MNTSDICQALEQLHIPYLITDMDFVIQWSNNCLKKHYSYLEKLHSLNSLLFGYDTAVLQRRLSEEDASITLACKLPLVALTLTLSPLKNPASQQTEAIVVAFTGCPSVSNQGDPPLTSFGKQLRAPISGLFGSIDLLRRHLEEAFQPELQSMVKDCYQMLRACVSITEYTEYINGSTVLNHQYGDLCAYLREQLEPAVPSLKRLGITLRYELPPEPLYLLFDPEKLSVVLFSLLSNSCMYGEENNSITVTLTKTETHAKITISDSGYGIPAEILPNVMEPYFSRGLDTDAQPGIGLGLPLSKAIIDQHGGTLALQSIQDQGTTVAFSLPLKAELNAGNLPLRTPAGSYNTLRYSTRDIFLSAVLPPSELN